MTVLLDGEQMVDAIEGGIEQVLVVSAGHPPKEVGVRIEQGASDVKRWCVGPVLRVVLRPVVVRFDAVLLTVLCERLLELSEGDLLTMVIEHWQSEVAALGDENVEGLGEMIGFGVMARSGHEGSFGHCLGSEVVKEPS